MHILLIHQAFAALDEAGGTRHYEMASFLAGQGHRVTIIASPVSYLSGKNRSPRTGWSQKENPIPGITIIRTYTYSALHRSFFHRVLSFFSFMVSSFIAGLGAGKVDVVWGTSPPIFQGFTAWLLAQYKVLRASGEAKALKTDDEKLDYMRDLFDRSGGVIRSRYVNETGATAKYRPNEKGEADLWESTTP